MHQQVRYCTADDGVRLAYSVIGKGSPVVRPSHWLTHLEYDLESPVWRHVVLGLAQRHSLVRFDARGSGMSQRDVTDVSFERWVGDLEVVVDAVALPKFTLLGVSQGAAVAVAYAVRHPERVSHLILYGGFARGALRRGPEERERVELGLELVRQGWGSDQEAYRQWFTSQFIPGGSAEQYHWFNRLQQVSATPEMSGRSLAASADIDVAALLPQVTAPTLVMHCRGDARVPFSQSEELAAQIPGATFVPLKGDNHLFLAGEAAHRAFFDAVADFLGDPRPKHLVGTEGPMGRLPTTVRAVEQSWLLKLAVVVLTIVSVGALLLQAWRLITGASG